MIGITFNSWDFFESVPPDRFDSKTALQIDAEIMHHKSFCSKMRLINYSSLSVRNIVQGRLNRLILDSDFKLKAEYLDSFSAQLRQIRQNGIDKLLLDFDLAGIAGDAASEQKLIEMLTSLNGMIYENNLKAELLFRLPQPDMDKFIPLIALLRRRFMFSINFAADLHIHEAGFEPEMICTLLHPVLYDIKSCQFIYDADLGNKFNIRTLKNIIDYFSGRGAMCDFFLCPSGNINFHTVNTQLEEWKNI